MKTLLITALLTFLTIALILLLDYLLGTSPVFLVWKVIYPFRVMEPEEYVIMMVIFVYFLTRAVRSFQNKKKGKRSPGS